LNGNILTASAIGTAIVKAHQVGDQNWNPVISLPSEAIVKSNSSFTYDYQIANWYENKKSATVLTYDDWCPGHNLVATGEHVSRNLPATFFVTLDNMWRGDDYVKMKALIGAGSEIANHTKSHAHLTNSTPSQLKVDINDTKNILDLNLPEQKFKVITFAYPYGEYNDRVIDTVMKKHVAARGVTESVMFPYNFAATVRDYYTIGTCEVSGVIGVQSFTNTLDRAIGEGGLLTFMIHGVNDGWFDNITTAQYTAMLDTIESRDYKTWNTTFLNAVRYHREKNSATLNVVSDDVIETVLSLSDTLANNYVYSHPLTITKNLNIGDSAVLISQAGVDLPYVQANGMLSFNAIPDAGNIVIKKASSTSGVADVSLNGNDLSVYPNPTSGQVHISNTKEIVGVKVFDLSGNEVLSIKGKNSNSLDFVIPKSGFYFLKIQLIDSIEMRKVIVE
jgi:peptidoglycan/xylan/chitin deacetylase (PgdA/CDA1 family)